MDTDDYFVPTSPSDLFDGEELGLIYYGGHGYTPNDVRDFISRLEELVEAAEEAARWDA